MNMHIQVMIYRFGSLKKEDIKHIHFQWEVLRELAKNAKITHGHEGV